MKNQALRPIALFFFKTRWIMAKYVGSPRAQGSGSLNFHGKALISNTSINCNAKMLQKQQPKHFRVVGATVWFKKKRGATFLFAEPANRIKDKANIKVNKINQMMHASQ